MLKSPRTLHSHGPPPPARLVVFWAHNPDRSDRVLKKTFMHYKIDPEVKSAAEAIAPTATPSGCPLAEWRFKVSHFNPTDSSNLRACASSASDASADSQSLSRYPKLLTFLYAIIISGQNSDVVLTDSNLNKIIIKTFNLMADL